MMSRRDGSSTTINVIATGKAKPVTASNSIINITEKVHTFPVQEGTYIGPLCFGFSMNHITSK